MLTFLLGCHDLHSIPRRRCRIAGIAIASALALAAPAARGTAITDGNPGVFLPTFAGPHNADLDVVSANATFDGSVFHLSATEAGAVGTTANGLYVWGIDRGGATDILAHLPNPVGAGVTFNAIVVVAPDGTGVVVLVNPDGTPASDPVPLAPGSVTVADSTISVDVPVGLLPSTGAAVEDYGFNVWSRIVGITSNDQVADFAPDGTTFRASAVPEPASPALLLAGLGLLGVLTRRRASMV
jgi:hypothetical protein